MTITQKKLENMAIKAEEKARKVTDEWAKSFYRPEREGGEMARQPEMPPMPAQQGMVTDG